MLRPPGAGCSCAMRGTVPVDNGFVSGTCTGHLPLKGRSSLSTCSCIDDPYGLDTLLVGAVLPLTGSTLCTCIGLVLLGPMPPEHTSFRCIDDPEGVGVVLPGYDSSHWTLHPLFALASILCLWTLHRQMSQAPLESMTLRVLAALYLQTLRR